MGKKKEIDPALEPLLRKGPTAEELTAGAVEAEVDTESLLGELELVQNERSRWNENHDLDTEYQRLREKATELLLDGPRYFIDHDGVKMIAVRRQSEPVKWDPELLQQRLLERGLQAVWERVAPRKIDAEQAKRAAALGERGGGIPLDIYVECAEFVPNKPFVQFISAESLNEE